MAADPASDPTVELPPIRKLICPYWTNSLACDGDATIALQLVLLYMVCSSVWSNSAKFKPILNLHMLRMHIMFSNLEIIFTGSLCYHAGHLTPHS
jgi:hypothetical protein